MLIIQTHWIVRFNDWLYCQAFELSKAEWQAELPKYSDFFIEGLKSGFSFQQAGKRVDSFLSDSDFVYGNYRASQLKFEEDFQRMDFSGDISSRLQKLFKMSATPNLTAEQKQRAIKSVNNLFNDVFEDCEVLFEFDTLRPGLDAKKHPAQPHSIFWSVIGFSDSRKRAFYLEVGDN